MLKTITYFFLLIMEVFANIEIIYNMYVSIYINNMIMIFKNRKITPLEYIFVKDGEEKIITTTINNIPREFIDTDFIIEKKWDENDKIFYGKIVERIQDLKGNNNIYNNFFLSITLLYKDENYDIDLEKPINFYIEGNILLDYSFIKWYANKYLNLIIDKNDNYEIILIDEKTNVTNITNISYVELNNKNYTLTNTVTNDY